MSIKLFLLLTLVVLTACDGADEEGGEEYVTPDLSGAWELSGSGRQEECDDVLENYHYEMSIEEGWNVRAEKEFDAQGEEVSDGNTYKLVMENAPLLMTEFEGMVEGKQVSFSFVDGESEQTHYSFFGDIENSEKISGTFYAEGSNQCKTFTSNSSFVVVIS